MTAMKISTAISLVLGLAAAPAFGASTEGSKDAGKANLADIGEKCEMGFSAADINNDGKISWREARSHQGDVFSAADANQDGFLTRSEFRECMRVSASAAAGGKSAGQQDGKADAERFTAMDMDEDKQLTRSEYMSAGQKAWGEASAGSEGEITPDKYTEFMGSYGFDPETADLNDNGKISEIEAALAASRGFASMDVDRDDAIDETEWQQGETGRNSARLFEWMDLNNDGRISMKESALASMRSFDTASADEPRAVPVWVFRSYYIR